MYKTISAADFELLVLRRARTFSKKFRISIEEDDTFVKRDPTPLLSYQTVKDIKNDIDAVLKEIVEIDEKYTPLTEMVAGICDQTIEANNAFQLISVYYQLLSLESSQLIEDFDTNRPDFVRISASTNEIRYDVEQTSPELSNFKEAASSHSAILLESMRLNEKNRESIRPPTLEESALTEAAQQSILEGGHLPSYYQSLGTAGFREIQTYLSIADPGEGHETVLASSSELLKGVVVHVEHIDRDKTTDKSIVEPYRLPAAINAAKVRVVIGQEAPVTAFIGRPMFENFDHDQQLDPVFDLDLLKTSHYTASACSTMFMVGIADCKIGFERMTIEQSVTFAQAVVGNVIRDRDRQYLSAAFNVNTPLIVSEESKITDRFEVARKGIQIAADGGFDKVTWDGASNQIPSEPIIDQLSHEEFVTLIHEAHEKGLETYISAGLQPNHMERCVNTGVDGIGIGTSLHYKDPDTKLMGALKPEAIKQVLSNRDEAATKSLGRAAKLLAKLDREYYEKIISEENEKLRLKLFEELKAQNVENLIEFLGSYKENYQQNTETNLHPLISQAHRLESSVGSLLEREMGQNNFDDFRCKIRAAVQNSDITTLRSYLR